MLQALLLGGLALVLDRQTLLLGGGSGSRLVLLFCGSRGGCLALLFGGNGGSRLALLFGGGTILFSLLSLASNVVGSLLGSNMSQLFFCCSSAGLE